MGPLHLNVSSDLICHIGLRPSQALGNLWILSSVHLYVTRWLSLQVTLQGPLLPPETGAQCGYSCVVWTARSPRGLINGEAIEHIVPIASEPQGYRGP